MRIVIAVAVALAGCSIPPKITAVTDRTVVVRGATPDDGVEAPLALANAECAKRGLSARVMQVSSPSTDRYIFECVRS
jgi:uncharacterized protein YcfL